MAGRLRYALRRRQHFARHCQRRADHPLHDDRKRILPGVGELLIENSILLELVEQAHGSGLRFLDRVDGVDELADGAGFRDRIDGNGEIVIVLDIHDDIEHGHGIDLLVGDEIRIAREFHALLVQGLEQ